MTTNNFKFISLIALLPLLLMSSCVKDKFDAPDNGGCLDEGLERNITIAAFKSLYNGVPVEITDDFIIEGVVVSSDKEGNFFKELVIQDETGGILLIIDQNNLHTDYPAGRKVYIKTKSLYLSDYGGLIQLGASIDEESGDLQRIPQSLMDEYIFKGPCNQTVEPLKLSISELNEEIHQSMLVELDFVALDNNDAGKPYADAGGSSTQNRTIVNCNGTTAILRNSDFASFADETMPKGLFSMTAVFSVFNGDKQFKIRNTRDIVTTDETCPCEEVTDNVIGTTTYQLDDILIEDDQQNTLLEEGFQSTTEGDPVSLNGWKNITENTTEGWESDGFQQDLYARVSCYQSGNQNVVKWLITPPITINGNNESLRFETKDAFNNGAILEVLISEDYNGGNTPGNATWQKVCPDIAQGTSSGFAANWTVGEVDLSSYSGAIYIAFRYKGSDE